MGLTSAQLKASLDHLAGIEPRIAAALARVGYPEPRINPRGYTTLLRTIVGQQVSYKAAAAMWSRLDAEIGGVEDPANIVRATDEMLRAGSLSRQKAGYARSLAQAVVDGTLTLDALPEDDEAAIAQLIAIKGIGRWSAEVYLLFAEGRTDIWPAGDLAVQIETGRIMGLDARPDEKATRAIAEAWRPHRGAAAVFTWHHYKTPVI